MQKPKHMKPVIGVNDLQSQRPEIAARLDTVKSGLTAQDVTYGARISLWWHCLKEDHSFPATPNQMANGKYGCGYCSSHRVLPGFNDLATLNPELVSTEWDFERNTINPSEITVSSHIPVWWLCPKYRHSTYRPPNSRGGCPYCSGNKVLVGFNDLGTVNQVLSEQWHSELNGELTPQQFTAGSHKAVWWRCSSSHEWKASIKQRATRGCKNCIQKTSKVERSIAEKLQQAGFKTESSRRDLLDGKEIDIYLPDHKIGVEFNGTWWHSEERGTPRDRHYSKWATAKDKGIDLLFIEEIEYERSPEILDELIAFLSTGELINEIDTSKPIRNGTTEEVAALRAGYTVRETLAPSPRYFNLNKRIELTSPAGLSEGKKLATIWGAGSSFMSKSLLLH